MTSAVDLAYDHIGGAPATRETTARLMTECEVDDRV